MAESQAPYNYQQTHTNLLSSLSFSRFKPYLVSAGYNHEYAFSLYLYNARLSKASLFPLHILEVSLRNRINDIFCHSFGEQWCHDLAFRQLLTDASRTTLDKAIERAKSRDTADIVATLSFDFWSNLFRSEYDRALWQTRMHELLPNAAKSRSDFQQAVRKINTFRNRIAHYEPIYKLDISQIHAELLDMLAWISTDTSLWVKHFSTVNHCLRTRPSGRSHVSKCVAEIADKDFRIVKPADTLAHMPGEAFTLYQADDGNIMAVIELKHFAQFLLSHQEAGELLIALKDYSFRDLITHCKSEDNFVLCNASENLHSAVEKMKGKKRYLIVKDEQTILGVIAKAHRKY